MNIEKKSAIKTWAQAHCYTCRVMYLSNHEWHCHYHLEAIDLNNDRACKYYTGIEVK